MAEKKQKIITVRPEEAAIVKEADRIDRLAWQESERRGLEASEEAGRTLVDPLVLYERKEDQAVIEERNQIAGRYQEEHHLGVPPLLIVPAQQNYVPEPYVTQQTYPTRGGYAGFQSTAYNLHQHSSLALIPEDLMQRFLRHTPLFRDGERLYLWCGTHYRCCTENELKGRIKTVLGRDLSVPNPNALFSNLVGLLKVEESISGKADNFPELVAVRNGTLRLGTMTLTPASPSRFLTHFLDVPWMGPQPCPVFSSFLEYASAGDPVWAQRLLEAMGYLLVSDYRAKRFVVFQGAGDCGKSVLGNLLASFFEEGACAALTDYQISERFALSFIVNSRFCSCMDLSSGTIDVKAVSLLKQITGGDAVSIEAKGKDAYTGHINCKVLFGTNHPIKLKMKDEAFAKRLLLVPFLRSVPDRQKDRGLLEKLKMERPGILHLALTAYRDVVQRGFVFTGEDRYGFTAEQIVLDAAPTNSIELFASQCCQLIPGEFTTSEALHGRFMDFCAQCNLPTIMDRAAFSRNLKLVLGNQIQPEKRRVNGCPMNGYVGITLTSVPPQML